MTTTEHEIPADAGVRRVRVTHDDHLATQYEFYIPDAIWNHKAVRAMLRRLEAMAPGATSFSRLAGVWDRKPETTRIYRMILRADRHDPAETRLVLNTEVGRTMAELSADASAAQDAFMYTETSIHMTMSGGVEAV